MAVLLYVCLMVAWFCAAGQETAAGPSWNATLGPERDRDALLALKAAIQGFGRSQVQEWGLLADSYPCSTPLWPHLTCKDGRVTKVDLSDLAVAGSLPAALREMDALRVLDLEGNRFAGSIPVEWGEPFYFPKLSSLSLAGNLLNGSLPNREWGAEGSWPLLRTLSLAGNRLWGGLPDGWFSGNRTFRTLRRLDLSDNRLGYADAAGAQQLEDQAGWCLGGEPPERAGWCAPAPLNGTAGRLEFLDLSANGLRGQLPQSWPLLFPRLRTLRLHGNQLSVQPAAAAHPAPLPAAWTAYESPDTAFSFLEDLVLYPGNDWICSLPDGMEGGYLDINQESSYPVSDDSGNSYDSSNPWVCPGPPEDNPPTITALAVDPATGAARLSWAPPAQAAEFVYGYRLTLKRWDPDSEDWVLVPDWASLGFRTFLDEAYTALALGLSQSPEGVYSLELAGYASSGRHRAQVSSFNTDSYSSTPAQLEVELLFGGALNVGSQQAAAF